MFRFNVGIQLTAMVNEHQLRVALGESSEHVTLGIQGNNCDTENDGQREGRRGREREGEGGRGERGEGGREGGRCGWGGGGRGGSVMGGGEEGNQDWELELWEGVEFS